MSNGRLPYLLGGALVAGFAALSIMSFNALRSDINRTSEIVLWSVVKDSTDKNVLASYLDRYPDGVFAKVAKSRMDDLVKGVVPVAVASANGTANGTQVAQAGPDAQRQAAELEAARQAAEQARADAEKQVAEAKAQAKAEAEKAAAQARQDADRQVAAAKAAAERQTAQARAEAEAKAAAEARSAAEAKASAERQVAEAKAGAARQAAEAKAAAEKAAAERQMAEKQAAEAKAAAERQIAEAKAAAEKQASAAKAAADKQAAEAKAAAEKQAAEAKAAADKAAAERQVAAAKAAAEKQAAEAKAAAEKQAAEAKVAAEKQAAEAKAAADAKAAAQKQVAAAQQQQQQQQIANANPGAKVAAKPTVAGKPAAAGDEADAGQYLIISSTAEGLKKGDKITASQNLSVPSGTRLVLMDLQGKVITVRGPFTGVLGNGDITSNGGAQPRPYGAFRAVSDAAEAFGRLGEALRDQQPTAKAVGAFRGVGPGLGLNATPLDPWTIDVSASGDWCVAQDRAITLSSDGKREFDSITVEMVPGGAKVEVPWQRTQATASWPAGVPVRNGATYQVSQGGQTTSLKLHQFAHKDATPGQTALWLAEQGCQKQASLMIDSLERGAMGRLFDLEVGNDGRRTADYRINDELKLAIRSSAGAYVYCFYRDVAGEVTKIFPSQFDPSARIGDDGQQSIPAAGWQLPMQLTGPAGASEVRCFALDRDATAQLPAEIAKPGFTVLTAHTAAALMEIFKQAQDGSMATAALPISVKD